MTTFGDKIKDIPVDRDESVSPDQELINSIFAPKEQPLIPREVKLFLIGAIGLYLIFTNTSQTTIYRVSKNDNATKIIAVCIVILVLYFANKYV